ncbi:hypothetical protein [Pseudomonas sp. NA-150]|uniref:hypothetical protein n=1 Tax=Pseudomonas sp. NA-150 TaxID=3367525 RepID=UPI0037C5995F
MNDLQQTLDQLRAALGDSAVITGAAINQRHYSDWTGHAPACPASGAVAAHHRTGGRCVAHLQ